MSVVSCFDRMLSIFATVAALLLLAMVIIITGDILMRNLFVKGFVWANKVPNTRFI